MSFSEKLYQNFIEDDRWLLLVNGLKVTILVTLFALLVGVIIGFTVAIIRSLHEKSMVKVPFIKTPTYGDYVSTDAETRRIAAELVINGMK